jgi:hypothetical protein
MSMTAERSTSGMEFSGTLTQRQWKFLAYIVKHVPKAAAELGITPKLRLAHHSEFTPAEHAEGKRIIDAYAPKLPKRVNI